MTTITQSIVSNATSPNALTMTPSEFDAAAAAKVLEWTQMGTDINTWSGQVNTVAGEVNANAGTATTQAGTATTQAGIATTQAGIATTQAGIATTQAGIATTQAGIASGLATALTGTSTSTLTPSLAEKTVTTQSDKSFPAGSFVELISASAPSVWMYGAVTSYSGTTLVFTPSVIGTATSKSDWAVLGRVGAQGAQGASGTGITPDAVGWHGTGGTTPKTLTVDVDFVTSTVLTGVMSDPVYWMGV